MAPSSETNPRPPEDFARMLAAPEPLLLVGGQAVNLWALHYEDRVRDLAPFVSRDTDVLGDRATLELLGKLAGARPQYFPLKPPSNEVGVVIAHNAEGEPLLIEVLRNVRGASNEEIRETTYRFALGEPAVQVKAPGPIALLQAKIANLAEIKQTGRQDGRHVVILARIMPAYLEDLCTSATAGRMDERKLLKLLEKLLAIITSPTGRKTWSNLRLDPWALFDGLRPDGLPRLQSFLSQRLPRALPRG